MISKELMRGSGTKGSVQLVLSPKILATIPFTEWLSTKPLHSLINFAILIFENICISLNPTTNVVIDSPMAIKKTVEIKVRQFFFINKYNKINPGNNFINVAIAKRNPGKNVFSKRRQNQPPMRHAAIIIED